jgi:dihydrofolate synthase / folylpolyglutamate synthase
MDYIETLDYLYSQLPMFSRIGVAAYKKDLRNTIELCDVLGNPQHKFKSIHIAGTNGKGSTSHMLAAILQQAGYKTGLYTSPHLKDFRERIKINGRMVPQDFVVDFVAKTKTITQQLQPSFFELTVAMAFEYFAQQQVDIAVIETGLGGRLDSTNIITPILSIITNIGYDHMNILGNTLPEIAFEKAGIIKPNIPVVVGQYLPETKMVFEKKAAACNAPIYFVQDEYQAKVTNAGMQFLTCSINIVKQNNAEIFELDLNGLYQIKNLCTVLCAARILKQQGFTISSETEKYALAHVKQLTGLHGRWDVISQNPTVVLDVAHNEDGIKQVIHHLKLVADKDAAIHFVLGMVKDKDVEKVLALLPTNARYYFTNAHIPRALPASELQQKATFYNLTGNIFKNVNEAIAAAKVNAAISDMIIVLGSVFLVGEVE